MKDLLISVILFILATPFQVFDLFGMLNPYLLYTLTGIIGFFGLLTYYIIPNAVVPRPWSFFRFALLDRYDK